MAIAEEKISFVLYGSYAEQLDMLTNEQAGKWIKGIYNYVQSGEKHSDDPMVKMFLSVVSHQLDIDARKYAEKLERQKEAGRKAGKASAAKRAMQQQEEIQRLSTTVDDRQRFQHEDDDVDVYVDEDENEDVDEYADVDADVLNNISGGGGEEEEEHARAHAREVIHIFDGQYPTTQHEQDKFQSLADELFVRYAHKQPTEYDRQQVFENTYSRQELGEDGAIAVLDDNKAELLRYAFQKAAEADKVHWSYINGIYANFRHRDIECVDDAYRDNWERKYGVISA